LTGLKFPVSTARPRGDGCAQTHLSIALDGYKFAAPSVEIIVPPQFCHAVSGAAICASVRLLIILAMVDIHAIFDDDSSGSVDRQLKAVWLARQRRG